MEILPDGTVIPSGFFTRNPSEEGESLGLTNDYALHFGEILRVHYPDDRNAPKDQVSTEYDVLISWTDPTVGVKHKVTLFRCRTMDTFGGLADHTTYTLRGDDAHSKQRSTQNIGMAYGSKVLILCAEGAKTSGVIIGGLRDENYPIKASSKGGHHYRFTFNGVSFIVNKDGEITVVRRGPTEIDGSYKKLEGNRPGTILRFSKGGGILFITPGGSVFSIAEVKGHESIKLISQGSHLHISHKGIGIINKKGQSIVLWNDEEKAQIIAKTTNIISDTVDIKASNVNVGVDADQAMVRGDEMASQIAEIIRLIFDLASTIDPITGSPLAPLIIGRAAAALIKWTAPVGVLSLNCKVK